MHINICAIPVLSLSVWIQQAFGEYLGEPGKPPHASCAVSCAVPKPPHFRTHKLIFILADILWLQSIPLFS